MIKCAKCGGMFPPEGMAKIAWRKPAYCTPCKNELQRKWYQARKEPKRKGNVLTRWQIQ